MPCILKVRIVSARNLPIMDRTTELTDAFVEVKFADLDTMRTPVCRKTLNPVWNEDFRFEVIEDSDLQNEPLEIKILDYDQISYNESIGSVLIDLNPLLAWDSNGQISGWFPIYDTMYGIRGELNAQVKIQFFGNINPFKDSSAGVQFFSTPVVPVGFQVVAVLGFVSSIQSEDDPEYHWADSFRTPRKSNEARTRVLFRLSGGRMLGKKVLDLGGNAVLGFKQYFDLEAEKKSITVRSIGTAVKLMHMNQPSVVHQLSAYSPGVLGSPLLNSSPEKQGTQDIGIFDLDEGESSLPSAGVAVPTASHVLRPQDPVFLTLNQFPGHFIISIGGFVCAASIKILENDDRETRDMWWTEIRDEIKSHARTVSCSHVIGYTETISINDEVAFLFCSGTAVNVDLSVLQVIFPKTLAGIQEGVSRNSVSQFAPSTGGSTGNLEEDISGSNKHSKKDLFLDIGHVRNKSDTELLEKKRKRYDCRSCHISYKRQESPFPMALTRCGGCKKKFVPEVLLSTSEPPPELELVGSLVLIEAHVCRPKKSKVGESRATIVSESIPFAQYDIHRQLMYKLRIYGLNAVFGLKVQFSLGDNLLTAFATGTAVYVKALPTPPALKVFRTLDVIDEEDKQLLETQRKLMIKSESNRKKIEEALADQHEIDCSISDSDSNSSSDDEIDHVAGGSSIQSRLQQRAMVVEIDDEQDEDLVLFLDDVWNENFQMCNIEIPCKTQILTAQMNHFQMVKMVKQSSIDVSHHPNRQLATIFKSMYLELANQLSFLSPCSITGMSYSVDIPKDSIVQVYMTAMVHGKLGPRDLELLNFEMEPTVEENFDVQAPAPVVEAKPSFFGTLAAHYAAVIQPSVSASTPDQKYDDEDYSDEDLGDIYDEEGDYEKRGSIGLLEQTLRSSTFLRDSHLEHIELSQLSYIPSAIHQRYLGRICHTFIKESNLIFDNSIGNSGMGGFSHVFMIEMMAVIKAHVLCLGGNAVVGFSVDQIHFTESLKSQGYALLSMSGDVCEVSYSSLSSTTPDEANPPGLPDSDIQI